MDNQLNELKNGKHTWRGLLVLFVIGAATLCLLILVCLQVSISIIKKHQLMFLCLSCVSVVLMVAIGIVFLLQEKNTLYKSVVSALMLTIFFSILLLIAEWTDFITILTSEELYEQFLEKTGAWMPIIYIILHVIQVLFLPIPGIFSILVGIRLFGAFLTAVYSYIGILCGSLRAFFIGKRLGVKAVSWLIGEENLNKWRNRIKGKDNLVLSFMFLLPLFPDDILCFVAGISTMSNRFFIIMVLATRAISVLGSCYSIAWIPLNTWWGILCWILIALSAIIAFVVLYKNIDSVNNFLSKGRKRK